jgi:hypothetical protein
VASKIIHEGTHYLQERHGGKLSDFTKEFQAFVAQRQFLTQLAAKGGRDAVPRAWRKFLNYRDYELKMLVEQQYGHEGPDKINGAKELEGVLAMLAKELA